MSAGVVTQLPSRVVVAGDWHGHAQWATSVIGMLPQLLPEESPRRILHCGDFGIWPGQHGRTYLTEVSHALEQVDGQLWFVDGNHEDFSQLRSLRWPGDSAQPPTLVKVTTEVFWMPRGYRWSWHGREWLALGGATSVDRPMRTEGRDWWPEEALTAADCEFAARFPADVMITHDCPARVPLTLPRPAPAWWELGPAEKHRETLQAVVDAVRPTWLMHGHYHLAHETTVRMPHGEVHVTGLAADEALSGNYRVLNVRTMAWGTQP